MHMEGYKGSKLLQPRGIKAFAAQKVVTWCLAGNQIGQSLFCLEQASLHIETRMSSTPAGTRMRALQMKESSTVRASLKPTSNRVYLRQCSLNNIHKDRPMAARSSNVVFVIYLK